MEQIILVQGITLHAFLAEIESIVAKQVALTVQAQLPPTPPKYLTRSVVAKLLHISLPTLSDWTKTGRLKSYRIGSRVLYKRDEIDAGLKKTSSGKR
jgi:excisionase family DNA binding protein